MPEMDTTDKVMDPNELTLPLDGDKVKILFRMSLASAPDSFVAWSHPDEHNAVHVDSNGEMIKTDTIDQAVCKMMELRQSDEHYEFVLGAGVTNRRLEWEMARMHLAQKKTIEIPAQDAFGADGLGNVVPPDADLIYEVELVAINGRKHVTTLETITKFEEELSSWKASKEAEYDRNEEFREKQNKKHTDREGYVAHLTGIQAKKLTEYQGAKQYHEGIVALGELNKDYIVNEKLNNARIYLCPYVVCKMTQLREKNADLNSDGRGFVFVESPNTMLDLFFHESLDQLCRPLNRSLSMEYLDMDDGWKSLCARLPLGIEQIELIVAEAVNEYDPEQEVPIVWLSKCGYLTCLKVTLVPDLAACERYSVDYVNRPTIRLDLDSATVLAPESSEST